MISGLSTLSLRTGPRLTILVKSAPEVGFRAAALVSLCTFMEGTQEEGVNISTAFSSIAPSRIRCSKIQGGLIP